jgi:hypothetical protein
MEESRQATKTETRWDRKEKKESNKKTFFLFDIIAFFSVQGKCRQ